ncbi:AI-2E family transporter [Roseovarius aestuariivivens]|uniref:AI-2E family transporter n=1 Tax=Roseovarius aestuariivivens TaxID=1888910 RepID=UPI001AEC6791|nr:AI-2E family transporter [Roseovarius aestuariivivens]
MSNTTVETEPPISPEPSQPVLAPRWAVIGIFLMLLVAGLAYARAFLMPVVLGLLLHLVFTPVRRRLERWGIGSGISATLIVGTLLSLLVVGSLGLSGPVSKWIDRAPMIGYEVSRKIDQLRVATEDVQRAAEEVDDIADGNEEETEPGVQRVQVEENSGLIDYVTGLPWLAGQIVFTLVLLFFLLSSGDMFYEKLVHVIPTFRDKRRAIRIAYSIERELSRYLFTITLINAGLGIAIGLVMWGLGMPNPVLFGILGFLLNYMPYLGALTGVGIATVVALITFDTAQQALIVGAVYFALTSIEGQLVTPYFVSRNLSLNTVVVFLSVTLFAWLWSVVGMLVAMPLLVTLRTFCAHVPALSGLGHFVSARGAESLSDRKPPAKT